MTARDTRKNKTKIPTRLRTAAFANGFITQADFKGGTARHDSFRMFYDFCIEEMPRKPAGLGYGQKAVAAGPRWKRLENFGKKSFDDLCLVVGETEASNLKGCFGVMVSSELYYRLKKMAEKGQIK